MTYWRKEKMAKEKGKKESWEIPLLLSEVTIFTNTAAGVGQTHDGPHSSKS